MAANAGFGEALIRIHAAINQLLNTRADSTEECIPTNNDCRTTGNAGKSPKARRLLSGQEGSAPAENAEIQAEARARLLTADS